MERQRERVSIADVAQQVDIDRQPAADALDALFTVGSFRAIGLPKGLAVRACLEELSEPGGPLTRGSHYPVYTLRPEFAGAAQQLANWTSE